MNIHKSEFIVIKMKKVIIIGLINAIIMVRGEGQIS